MQRFMKISLCYLFALFLLPAVGWAREATITVGSIAEDPKTEVSRYQPIVDYLAKHLHEQGITKGHVIVKGLWVKWRNF